jgi:3'(2'), 5'-bisphosphate nucleotidase
VYKELEIVARLVLESGVAIMRLYGSVAAGRESSSPVTEADLASNRLITAGLAHAFSGDAILSEESADSAARLAAGRVWIVDPLDGTKEFLTGNGEFSVMVGLVTDGEPVLGVVGLPAAGTIYGAIKGMGAWRLSGGGSPERLVRRPADAARIRLVGSRSHSDPLVTRLAAELGAVEVRQSGSVGVKCVLIAEGQSDVYAHPGPCLKEWDTCAPEIVLREAGGEVTDCVGQRLRYNKAEPVQSNGIMACAPHLSDLVLERIAALAG